MHLLEIMSILLLPYLKHLVQMVPTTLKSVNHLALLPLRVPTLIRREVTLVQAIPLPYNYQQ